MMNYVVKHMTHEMGPLSSLIASIELPVSYSSVSVARGANEGGIRIYVVEAKTDAMTGRQEYFLGYRFVSDLCKEAREGKKWHDRWKYQNTVTSKDGCDCLYFEDPQRINDVETADWLRSLQRKGMTALTSKSIHVLDGMFLSLGSSRL